MDVRIREFRHYHAKRVAMLIPQLTPRIAEPEKLMTRLEKLDGYLNVYYIVAKVGRLVIGFGGLVWYPIPSKGMMGWIEEVVVDKPYRGNGVGKRITLHLLEKAEKLGLVQVKLTTADDGARHVYEKCGFVRKEEDLFIRKFYQTAA